MNIDNKVKVVIIALLIIILFTGSAQAGYSIIQVSDNENFENEDPLIDNGQIVWVGDDDYDTEIFMYDISTETTKRLTYNDDDDDYPQIDNGQIVWEQFDSDNIYLYYISTENTKLLTNNGDEPYIDNGQIVWTEYDGNDYEIFLYYPGLLTPKIQITNNGNNENIYQIDNGYIIWRGVAPGDNAGEIYLYDISTSSTTKITNNNLREFHAHIDEGIIVWERLGSDGYWDFDKYEIFMYDISTQVTIQVTTDYFYDSSLQIDNGKIVWNKVVHPYISGGGGWTVNNYEIYLYDTSTHVTTRVTTNDKYDISPQIANGKIVWESDGIFVYDISTETTTHLTNSYYANNPQIDDNGNIVWEDDEEIFLAVEVFGTDSVVPDTGGDPVYFGSSSGAIEDLTAIPANAYGAPPEGVNLEYGLFSFNITGITPGGAVTITLEFPDNLPVGTEYWKYGATLTDSNPHWYEIPVGDDDGDNVITIILTDGGLGDDDLAANGVIVDDGGPSMPSGELNQPPVANDDSGTTDEDTPVIIDAMANDTDPDGDSLSVISMDTTGIVGLVTNHGDGNFTYGPNGQFESLQVGESDTDSFTYNVSDGNGGTDEATVTITINGVNDAPVANDDSATTGEDTLVTIDVVANDSDPDGDTLLVDSVDSTGTEGQVTDNGDGTITYNPDGQFEYLQVGDSATDSFNYTVSDGNGGTDEATVTITINGVNDAPVANDDNYITAENTVLTVSAPGVLGNDADIDEGDTLTAILIDGPANGSVTLNANGSFTYTPNPDYYGFDTFTYKANDNRDDSNVATVTISIIPHSVVTSSSLCMFDYDTTLDGNQFKLIFTPNQDPINTYRLSASNPGQFFYNLYYPEGTEIEVEIPYPFVTQGAVPIHFYSDVQMSGSDGLFCFTPGSLIGSDAQIVTMDDHEEDVVTLNIIMPEGASFATIHLDYGLKKTAPYTNGGFDLQDAIGDSIVTENIGYNTTYQFSAGDDTAEIYNINSFKKTPGIGGLILEGGFPVDEEEVVIYSTVSGLVIVETDEDGWYMWNYKHKGKATEFTVSYGTETKTVTLKANKFAIVNFDL
ncbi:MAG: tandem-95 repeat protein [Candidatus Omnitrophica bacterium]|nr:tandem-95 repeat protein [Candidatus Omnitrophota bacterium]